jgi:mannose-6-phosphate isomerase-like protein (cupin superfamily)
MCLTSPNYWHDAISRICLRSSFSVGIYVLYDGATDPQRLHSEDEVYYVASGRAKMMIDSDGDAQSFDVYPSTIIFLPARVYHSFYEITERLLFSCSSAQPLGAL